MMLRMGCDDRRPRSSDRALRESVSFDGGVVGLGAAGRDDDLARLGADMPCEMLTRFVEHDAGVLSDAMNGACIPEDRETGVLHLRAHFVSQRSRGGVVEVDHNVSTLCLPAKPSSMRCQYAISVSPSLKQR